MSRLQAAAAASPTAGIRAVRAALRWIDPRLPQGVRRRLRRSEALAGARRWYRRDEGWWEDLYAKGPRDFETSSTELAKQDLILRLLGQRRYAHALEPGCAEGAFTVRLARHCDRLTAFDISEVAVRRARQRLNGQSGVRISRRTLPEGLPVGSFDLIVCSDVLFYFDEPVLRQLVAALRERLQPGGTLIAAHYRGDFDMAARGDRIHDLLPELLQLEATTSHVDGRYRLDRFDAPLVPTRPS